MRWPQATSLGLSLFSKLVPQSQPALSFKQNLPAPITYLTIYLYAIEHGTGLYSASSEIDFFSASTSSQHTLSIQFILGMV